MVTKISSTKLALALKKIPMALDLHNDKKCMHSLRNTLPMLRRIVQVILSPTLYMLMRIDPKYMAFLHTHLLDERKINRPSPNKFCSPFFFASNKDSKGLICTHGHRKLC